MSQCTLLNRYIMFGRGVCEIYQPKNYKM